MLQQMDKKVLQKICEHLKPVSYSVGHVFKTGKEIDAMLFVTEGIILPSQESQDGGEDNSIVTASAEKLDYFGEQLLRWVSPRISLSDLQPPIRTQKLKCHTKVEVFVLVAKDLKDVVNEFRRLWNWNLYKCDIDPLDVEDWVRSLNNTNEVC